MLREQNVLGLPLLDAYVVLGGFCGYRNIQMMASYIIGTGSNGAKELSHRIPSIFQIQDLIEEAWDRGINAQGRIETGGIRGTRKYIGTPEVRRTCPRLLLSEPDTHSNRYCVL